MMQDVNDAETTSSEVRASMEKIERIVKEVQWHSGLSLSSLRTQGKPSEDTEKVLMHFCEMTLGTMVGELPTNKTVELLRDWIMDLTGMSREPLADNESQRVTEPTDEPCRATLNCESLDLSSLSIPSSSGRMSDNDKAGSSGSEYRQKRTVKKLDRTFVIAKQGWSRKRAYCPICEAEMNKKNLNRHLKTFHGITEQQK